MKKFIDALLNAVGLTRLKKQRRASVPVWSDRIKHAKTLGFSPKVIFDGGAFKGFWTQEVARIFPNAIIIAIEPNPFIQDDLQENLSDIRPSPKIFNIAVGEAQGKAMFNIWREEKLDTGASMLEHVSGAAQKTFEVDVDTLDNISSKTGLKPDFVKLDLQGAELLALKGANQILKYTELVMIEFGCLEAYKGRATSRDLMEIMYKNDYCLYDIVDFHYRPFDGALTGGDYIFVKNSSSLRSYKGWA